MSWDFSTEPEFQEKLDCMRRFVHEEVIPLEVLDLTTAQWETASAVETEGKGRRALRLNASMAASLVPAWFRGYPVAPGAGAIGAADPHRRLRPRHE